MAMDLEGREHELMARTIKNNTEQKGILFTPLKRDGDKYKLGDYKDVEKLKNEYNSKLYKSKNNRIEN